MDQEKSVDAVVQEEIYKALQEALDELRKELGGLQEEIKGLVEAYEEVEEEQIIDQAWEKDLDAKGNS